MSLIFTPEETERQVAVIREALDRVRREKLAPPPRSAEEEAQGAARLAEARRKAREAGLLPPDAD